MASVLSHAIAAAAIRAVLPPSRLPLAIWGLGIVWSVVPDIDVIGFQLGVPYDAALGHRGLTHSLPFAAAIASVAVWLHRSRGVLPNYARNPAWAYLFFATASHGVLDAMTNGGLGIAFLAPFSSTRFFLPWRPIAVSPIGVAAFFSTRGLQVLATEVVWIWMPAAVLATALVLTRRMLRSHELPTSRRSAAIVDRSADRKGVALSTMLVTVLCRGLAAIYAWAGPRAIQEHRYATYVQTRTPEAQWLSVILPPSATLIHERHAIDIDLLYGSFCFDPLERRAIEATLTPGFRSNVRIDQHASFPHGLPPRPSVEVLRHSGFAVYSKKDFGLAIEWQKGIAFFWYSPS
jgi:inner membrane protein